MKKKELNALDLAREEMFAATEYRDRMIDNFNNALPEFFEVANLELTIAQLQVDTCLKKLKLLQEVS